MADSRNTKTVQTDKVPATEGGYVEQTEHLPPGIMETKEEVEHQWFVGSIDQGTTSTRFLIFNGKGDPVADHQMEFENMYPESGSVERTPFPLPPFRPFPLAPAHSAKY